MKAVKKIINVIIDIVVVLILIISILVVTMSLTSRSSGVPNLFGVAPITVASDSMEDTLMVNDLIFCEVRTDYVYDDYAVGDIVTFNQEIEGETRFNTHRIVEVVEDNGITYYKTQGDNKDTNPVPDEKLKTANDIVAKYTGNKIGGVGAFFSFIRTQLGFFLVILLPMILFFVYEAVRVIMNIIAYNKEKAAEEAAAAVANSELTEEQKQRAIEEYLAQQKLKQESEPTVQTPAEGDQSDTEL
ncbi:MAG: signal peptidase I [Ruminococcus sp.]|nr:signal peptidase I [Ruminococcus sp.]